MYLLSPRALSAGFLMLVFCGCASSPPRETPSDLATYCVAVCSEVRGDYKQSERLYRELAQRQPSNSVLQVAAARAAVIAGRTQEAFERLHMAWSKGAQGDDVLLPLCILSYRTGRHEAAIKYNREMLERDPSKIRPVYYLENALVDLGRLYELPSILEPLSRMPGASRYLRQRLEDFQTTIRDGEEDSRSFPLGYDGVPAP